jgi:hypothetical protein
MITDPSEKDEIYLNNVAKIGNSMENVQYIYNILSESEHNLILNYVESTEDWLIQPWGSESVKYEKIPQEVLDALTKVFKLANELAKKKYGVEINPVDGDKINLLKFTRGMSLVPHIDTESSEGNHIAVIYYINNDYIGGEICFPDLHINIKPDPNTLVIFPGNENYLHEVRTVYEGKRYTSSMWFQFTGSTFNKKKEWYD